MKRLQCEMCGSTNMLKQDGVFVCESCGTRYSVEEAKKMMAEDTVDENAKADDDTSDDLDELYEKARNARESDDYELAHTLYKKILQLDPSDWYSYLDAALCKVRSCTFKQMPYEVRSFVECLPNVVDYVESNVANDEKYSALHSILLRCQIVTVYMTTEGYKFLNEYDSNPNENGTFIHAIETLGAKVVFQIGDIIENKFKGEYSEISVEAWKFGIERLQKIPDCLEMDMSEEQELIDVNGKKIRKYDTSYVIPSLPNIASSDSDDDDDSEESYGSDYDDGGDESDSYVSDCYDGSNPDGSCGLNSYDNGGSEEHPVSEGVQVFLLIVGVFFGPVFLFLSLFFIIPKGDARDIFYSFVVSAIGFAALRKFYKNNKREI